MGASFTGMHRALKGYYGLRLLARQSLAAVVKVPASHRGRRGAPMARRDDREPGPPPRVVCEVGWQYREYLREEQRSQPGVPNAAAALGWSGDASPAERGPQRGSRAGGPECSRTFTTGCYGVARHDWASPTYMLRS